MATGVLLLVVLLKNGLQLGLVRLRHQVLDALVVAMIRHIFAEQLAAPYTIAMRNDVVRTTTAIAEDVRKTLQQVLIPLLELLSDALAGGAIFVTVLLLEPVATLALGGCLLASAVGLAAVTRARSRRTGMQARQHFDGVLRTIGQGLGSPKESRVLRREVFFRRRMRAHARGYTGALAAEAELTILPRLWMESTLFLSLFILTAALLSTGGGAEARLASLAVFAVAGIRLLPFVSRTLTTLAKLRLDQGPALAILDQLDRVPAATARAAGTVPARLLFRDRLTCRGLACGFDPVRPILSGLDLDILQGEFLALVGRSGIGKTTLVDTLLTLLPPLAGSIEIDGRPLDEVRVAWRRCLGYMPQDPYIADDSLRANLLFGLPARVADDDRLRALLSQVGLGNLLASLPEELATRLGVGGLRLSGGQRQRLCVARALLAGPEFLVLDEGTAQLDLETERRLFAALRAERQPLTVLVVTHRPQTAALCDRTIDLDRHLVGGPGSRRLQEERKAEVA